MIAVNDVLRVFRSASGSRSAAAASIAAILSTVTVPAWRKGGKLVEATYPDGQKKWICHYCGRAASMVVEK
jgi:hypothetical protein